jgi:sphingomyelin phosphodiesterase
VFGHIQHYKNKGLDRLL